MGVITTEQEISCSVPAKRLFKSLAHDAGVLMPKLIPEFFKSFENIQGDGGVGTIQRVTFNVEGMKPAKHRVEEVDEVNHVYKYTVLEGGVLGDDIESVTYVLKFVSGGEGGCSVKISGTYHPKVEENDTIKERIEKVKESTKGFFHAIEAHLRAHAE